MANQSIPREAPQDLPELLRNSTGTNVPFSCIDRDTYLQWSAAIADLLISADESAIADKTTSNAAWLMYELIKTVQAFENAANAAAKEAA